jgi:hypothetical protein
MKRLLTDPNKIGLWILLCVAALIALVVLLFGPDSSNASDLKSKVDLSIVEDRWERCEDLYVLVDSTEIESSILWLVRREPDWLSVKADYAYLWQVVLALDEAGEAYDLPVLLMASMIYKESTYKDDGVGPAGELGLMQVGKMGRRKCRSVCGSLSTPEEHILCGGCWLRAGIDWCGSLEGGLNAYAGGKCYPSGSRTQTAVRIRHKLWARLTEKVSENQK